MGVLGGFGEGDGGNVPLVNGGGDGGSSGTTMVATLGHRVNSVRGERLFTAKRVDAMVRPATDPGHAHLLNSKTTTSTPAIAPQWTQANPDQWCRCGGSNPRMGRCRNPRCSLEGRSGWAKKWATVLTMHLERQPANVTKHAGTLIATSTDRAGWVERRSAFVRAIRSRFNGRVRLLAVSEARAGLRPLGLHDHYVMVSEVGPVSESEVSTLWRKACGGELGAEVLKHEPIGDVSTWCRYIFKVADKYHDPANPKHARLLAKGSPSITWGSRFLSEKDRETLWAEKVAGWIRPHVGKVQKTPIRWPSRRNPVPWYREASVRQMYGKDTVKVRGKRWGKTRKRFR